MSNLFHLSISLISVPDTNNIVGNWRQYPIAHYGFVYNQFTPRWKQDAPGG